MTLPASGNAISLNQVEIEVLVPSGNQIDMNDANVRTLFGRTTAASTIYMSDGYSKTWVTAGTQPFTASGTFTVPK